MRIRDILAVCQLANRLNRLRRSHACHARAAPVYAEQQIGSLHRLLIELARNVMGKRNSRLLERKMDVGVGGLARVSDRAGGPNHDSWSELVPQQRRQQRAAPRIRPADHK
jgi:hypothetical protein